MPDSSRSAVLHFASREVGPGASKGAIVGLLLIFAAVYSAKTYCRGWYPLAEGLHLEAAARVLRGEIPYRDFGIPSSGGVCLAHAVFMRVFGETVLAPRVLVLTLSISAMSMVFLVLQRVLPQLAAGCVALTVFLWGPVHYLVPTPQWYVSLLGIHTVCFLTRFRDSTSRGWLSLAGVSGGLSFWCHPGSGLLHIVAALLFLLFLESRATGEGKQARSPLSLASRIGLTGVVVGAALILAAKCCPGRSLGAGVCLFAGPAALGALLAMVGLSRRSSLLRLLKLTGAYVVGALGGLLPLLLWLAARGGMAALRAYWNGAIVGPLAEMQIATGNLPDLDQMKVLVPLNACLVILYLFARGKSPHWWTGLVVVASVASLLYSILHTYIPENYQTNWVVLRLLLAESMILGSFFLWQAAAGRLQVTDTSHDLLGLCLCFAASFSFAQVPECSGTSLLYALPYLFMLLAVLLEPSVRSAVPAELTKTALWWRVAAIAGLLYLGFFPLAFLRGTDAGFYGVQRSPKRFHDYLHLQRGGVWVTWRECLDYESAVEAIRLCSEPDDYILAFPDCPMLYFLSGRRSPLRHYGMPREGDSLWWGITKVIEERKPVLYVYADEQAGVSMLRDSELMGELRRLYPSLIRYGRFYLGSALEPWERRDNNVNMFLSIPGNLERWEKQNPVPLERRQIPLIVH